jgi:hypothetical protein
MPSRNIPSRDDGSNDPLAELARLIGSGDPFADLDRASAPPADRRQNVDPPPSDWRATAAALARESMRDPPADQRYDEVDSAIAAAKSLRAAPNDRFAHYDQEPAYDQDAQDDNADNPYDDAPRGHGTYDDRHYSDHRADAHDPADEENYFFEGDAAPTDERFYDDPPRARATNSLLTVAVLVGCGILGTAGAYGYRTYYSGPRSGDAPIITTDKTPIKIMPADTTAKPNQDRVGDGNERMASRQEEPVTLADPSGSINSGSSGGSRGVLPPPFTPSPGPGPSVQGSAPTPSGAGSEPKKVRTLAILPDGSMDPTARPVGASPALQSAPPAAATRQPPQPATRPTPAPPTPATPARAGAGPLSIDPQVQTAAADPAYQAPSRAPAPPPAPAPKLASTSGAPTGGGYVVQVSSQPSEADAQTAFRGLQSKYPRELGDREAITRRVELGPPKGTVFRSLVGPFGTTNDAAQFCKELKAAGADCLVLKN